MPDGAELRLSKSSIGEWLRCHYAYFLHYVLRWHGAATPDMLSGRVAHVGIEALWRGMNPTAVMRDAAAAENPDPVFVDAVLRDARPLVATYAAKIVPTFTPTHIEARFAIRVDGVIVAGAIDAADDTTVHDTKTTSTPSKVDPERHRVEMSIYHHGARSLGLHPERLILDVIGRNGRTKSVPVEPDEQGMAEMIGYIAKEVRAGNFEPNGARTGACHGCGFARACPYSTLTTLVESSATGEPVLFGEGDA